MATAPTPADGKRRFTAEKWAQVPGWSLGTLHHLRDDANHSTLMPRRESRSPEIVDVDAEASDTVRKGFIHELYSARLEYACL